MLIILLGSTILSNLDFDCNIIKLGYDPSKFHKYLVKLDNVQFLFRIGTKSFVYELYIFMSFDLNFISSSTNVNNVKIVLNPHKI